MRLVRFFAVGWLGFAVQMASFAILTWFAHVPWIWATVIAAELSIVHNYVWHERWTWRDRLPGFSRFEGLAALVRFVRFNAATGIVGVGGNLALVTVYVTTFRLPPVVANVLAVATLSLVNFVVADRWVFLAAALLLTTPAPASAAPAASTIDAWNRYVAVAEERFERSTPASAEGAPREWGESVPVEAGTIVDWHGVVFIPDMTLDRLLERLLHPERAPLPDDVQVLRVLARTGDSLRTYLRLVRKAIVTVTYDTEHQMIFQRRTPSLLMARSVATSIREAAGGDRGFLWRMNSYWRYRQTGDGVIVEVQSLTLSRGIPTLARPVAVPIISHVARESMLRTLGAVGRVTP